MERILIVGIDTPIGLTLVRELGRHGVEVHGVARSERGVGLYSRYLTRGYILNGPRDGQLPGLLKILQEQAIPSLMAVSEADLIWLNRCREQLGDVCLLIPSAAQVQSVVDKTRVYEAAERVGVPIPRTLQPETLDQALQADLRFPVILKWSDPNEVAPQLSRAGLELIKFEYAYDTSELAERLRKYDPLDRYPLVQEFCPGHGLGQMFLIHKGKVALYFQHQRIHEWPPEGGSSTLCEALPALVHANLRAKSEALLRDIGWEGVAMVEYRHDPASGRSVLMEINGRFWGSQPLASHAGAEFAWELYCLQARGAPSKAERGYRTGFRCAYMIPELKRLAVILFAQGRIQNRSLRFSRIREVAALLGTWFNPSTRFYVFSWVDSKPFFADILLALREALKRRIERGVIGRLSELIETNFASFKGFVRLLLAEVEFLLGRLDRWVHPDLRPIRRLVFVCQGNINRSSFAHALARDAGLRAASFGLSTTTGQPAFHRAVHVAREMGCDLEEHKATAWRDFVAGDGDLYLAMEARHARKLEELGFPKDRIALLGHWSRPRRLHLHDPHINSASYFRTCFTLIESAVRNLALESKRVGSGCILP